MKHQAELDVPSYQSEKKGENSKAPTRCGNCNITVVKQNFSRHRKQCKLTTNAPVESVPTSLFEVPSINTYSDSFVANILAKFRNDEVGQICRTDSNTLKFFYKHRCKLDLG